MEVGPLARMLVAYASGHPRVKELVGTVLAKLGVGPEALFSTLGRVAARGIETLVLAERMEGWLDELAANIGHDLRIHDNEKWDPLDLAEGVLGGGLPRGPARGARPLGAHRGRGRSRTTSASCPAPGTRGPATRPGNRGPYEEALVGTPVADAEKPLEILRTVHSFDPCMACGVHVVDAKRHEVAQVRVP